MNKKLLLTLSESEIQSPVTFLEDGQIIIYKGENGQYLATWNRCKHRAGRFRFENNSTLTCANHNWKLNLPTMTYLEPFGKLKQPCLLVELGEGGTINLYQNTEPLPWEIYSRTASQLVPGELTLEFYTHATMKIQAGKQWIFSDPWLIGPASSRGWWLSHRPPSDWLEQLAIASLIYISHTHSDHLNLPTLRKLATVNPTAPVIFPNYRDRTGLRLIRSTGLKNIQLCDFKVWYELDEDTRYMLLQDSTGKDDSALLVEYKGHRILNSTDASAGLNDSILPNPLDVLFVPFAGGASGHPVCWADLYSDKMIQRLVNRNLQLEAHHAVLMVGQTQPRVVVPFAGYFTEAHPADHEIRYYNRRNSPQEVCRLIQAEYPEVISWLPKAGQVFDLATFEVAGGTELTEPPEYDFASHLSEIEAALEFAPLQSLAGVKQYFKWAGWQGDLVLHILETDESFGQILREYFLDFSDPELLLKTRPTSNRRYLRMKVRADVFRYVLKNALPWEEISVGFQARFYCEPDVYSYDFWHHFQYNLPEQPCF